MIDQSQIADSIRDCPGCVVDRVVVLDEAESTQEAAFQAFDGDPIVVIACRQTAGRGQRGNRWDDGDGETLACTFALPVGDKNACRLAGGAGLAALHAIKAACSEATDVRIKWPNDVVVRQVGEADRKIAGVLVEIRDGVVLIGIGINVSRQHWPAELDGVAASLVQVGGRTDRTRLACALVGQLTRWMGADDAQIRSSWADHDAMTGTVRSFIENNTKITGEVLSVDPLGHLVVRTNDEVVQLSVATTRNA